MKKLAIVLIVVAIVLLALTKVSPESFAVGEGMASMRNFGLALSGILSMGFLGGWFLFAPMVLRRSGILINLVGVVLVIPLAMFAYEKAANGALPALARSFNNRWGGSFVETFTPESLDEISSWLADMDEVKQPSRVVNMSMALGGYMQRLGRVPESIVHLERAHRVAYEEGSSMADSRSAVSRSLGIAYLREGEIASCLEQPNEHSCIFPLHEGGIWTDFTYAKKAEAMFLEVLEVTPEDPGARWLLALSQQVQGTYPNGLAEGVVLPEATMLGETTSPHFRNRAVDLGIAGDDNAGSVVMDDFDGDGFMDIITCSYDPGVPLTYQHNNGDGTFSDWTTKAGLSGHTGGLNLTHADYNGDGRLDILLLRGAWFMTMGFQQNTLLRQEEDGTFTDVSMDSGLGTVSRPSLAATWGDYDLDGDLDVYIGNERLTGEAYLEPEKAMAPCELFRNNGDGTFTDVAKEAGVRNLRFTRGAAFGDYDNDGWPDLVVSNLSQENRLYHNNGDGTFTDVGPEIGGKALTHPMRAFCSWFFDVNNDGNLDIFIGGYPLGGTVNEVMKDRYGQQEDPMMERCSLLLGDGKGGF
ncbi:MAG: FG-GAP repeat domain-containing protein, partial [Planctomycetota bacterium]